MLYSGVCTILISGEFLITVSRGIEYGTTVVLLKTAMNPLTKDCYPQCGVAKDMKLRAGGVGERLSMVKMHGILVCLPFLYSMLFCYVICVYYRHKLHQP